jgi:hypothetical protein
MNPLGVEPVRDGDDPCTVGVSTEPRSDTTEARLLVAELPG